MSTPMAFPQRLRPPRLATVSAVCVASTVRLALVALRFDHVMSAARWLAGTTRRTASLEEVEGVLEAVDDAARWVPVRLACMERSLTAVVLLAARRQGVTWRMGVRTPPLAAHAWLADAFNNPIGEPPSAATYQPLITISAPPTRTRSMT
ncbi:MAG: lasso peptide biosynthesis B2 protein [Actinobacteria bacterium]|nr:lasso peptide biosynthesis B2 protein [Actinomycetota bacterium]